MICAKQNTAVTIVLGPFVDQTDGFTAETALTIAQADVRLSKNGAAFAQKSDVASATHMENGNYSCPLNATDTNTLGVLRVHVNEVGALPVWLDIMVMPANVWDSLFGADLLQVDAAQWLGVAPSALIAGRIDANAQVVGDKTGYALTTAEEDAIVNKVWDELTAEARTVGSYGQLLKDYVNASLSAIKAKTDSLTFTAANKVDATLNIAADLAVAVANRIADCVLRRTYANARTSADGDAVNFRSLLGAVGKLVNKWSISGTTLTVFQEDDVTSTAPGGTQAITATAGADPVTALDTT